MNAVVARAPGRVNLIGEHTDYNDGFVMPAAIGYETTVEAHPRNDRTITIESEDFGSASFDADAVSAERTATWTDYARGVLLEIRRAGVDLPASDVRISSTVPPGAGLSSSASFEVALALAVLARAGRSPDRLDVARLAQRAEVDSVGTRSGIMDQFAALFGRSGCAVFLDARTLAYDYVVIPKDARLVICNTGVKHALAGGEYNARRAQCEEAVALLQCGDPSVRALRDVTPKALERARGEMPPVIYRRARHVVTENERVLQAVEAFNGHDLGTAGRLMNASHDSLRDDYEVSCKELDVMVAIARACEGVYGARMTGGGFGGCTVNLVRAGAAAAFGARVVKEYRDATGIEPTLYDGTPRDGAEVTA